MDLDFALLADEVEVVQPQGKLDIKGAGFDTVLAAAVPAQHAQMALAVRVLLRRHETEHPHWMDVVVQATDGAALARGRIDLPALPMERRNLIPAGGQVGIGLVLKLDGIVFPDYGVHQIVIQWDGTEARPPLRLFVSPPPTPPPGSEP